MRVVGVTVFGLACVLAPAGAVAIGVPVGSEFQANTYTSCVQSGPSAAPLTGGDFVVVWQSGSADYPQDGSYRGVFGRRFDATGAAIGSEFRANVTTLNSQLRADVASLNDGGFVVVWDSYGQDDAIYYGVYGRRFDSSGNPVGGEFHVNTYTTSAQYSAAISTWSGGFVVVWSSFTQDDWLSGVFGQRFNASAAKMGTEFQVHSATQGWQYEPDVAMHADGSFVVVWSSYPYSTYYPAAAPIDGSSGAIAGQRFDTQGNPMGSEFVVNSYTTQDQDQPSVAAREDGGFIVVWATSRNLGTSSANDDEVAARKFDDLGLPIGTEFIVNTYTSDSQTAPRIARLNGGGYIVAWQSAGSTGDDNSERSVQARRLDSAGNPTGTEFQINTFTFDDQRDPEVTPLSNGGFAVAWESYTQDGHLFGVFGQTFSGAICGDATGEGSVTASDALLALKTAVGSATCALCLCDVDGSAMTTATDALLILQSGVGQPVVLSCSAC